jgi:hypothetical protein
MMVLRGMRSAKVLMSCRSLWPTLEPQISMLGFILTLGTPPADRSTADCPLLLTVAALSHSLASSAACPQAPTWPCERIYMIAQRRSCGLRERFQVHRPWRRAAGARRGRWAVATDSRACAKVRTGARRRRRRRMQRKFRAPAARAQRMRLNERPRA